jgi:hypothetical protein
MGAEVVVTLTVDWEGRILDEKNLGAMYEFGKNLEKLEESIKQKIPTTHFFCPAYFVRLKKEDPRRAQLLEKLSKSQAIRDGDEIALHIHSWQSLVEAAGAKFTMEADYGNGKPSTCDFGIEELGQYGALGIYAQKDIENIMKLSIETILELKLTKEVKGFRCGGWLANDNVLGALTALKLPYDASAVPADYVSSFLQKNAPMVLWDWLASLWSKTENDSSKKQLSNTYSHKTYPDGIKAMVDAEISQPLIIKTLQGQFLEIPDTAMLADWAPVEKMQAHIDAAYTKAKKEDKAIYISLGYHQEQANTISARFDTGLKKTNIERIFMMLEHIVSQGKKEGVPYRFMRTDAVAAELMK